MEKAKQSCELWMQAYPRADAPHNFLSGIILPVFGQYDKALEEASEAVRLNSDSSIANDLLMDSYISLNRLDEAKAVYGKALRRGVSSPFFHFDLYWIAFLEHDPAGMAEQVAWSAGKPGSEDLLLGLEADTAAYSGRLRNARDFSRRAMESAEQAEERETAAIYSAVSTLREALFSNAKEAQLLANVIVEQSTGRDVQYGAALAMAYAGNDRRAQTLCRTPGTGFSQYNGLANLLAFVIRSENFGLYYIPQQLTTKGS